MALAFHYRFLLRALAPFYRGQFLFAVGESLAGGLDVDEVYRWRDAAWSEARRRLGQ